MPWLAALLLGDTLDLLATFTKALECPSGHIHYDIDVFLETQTIGSETRLWAAHIAAGVVEIGVIRNLSQFIN